MRDAPAPFGPETETRAKRETAKGEAACGERERNESENEKWPRDGREPHE
jgi:hypothetical protein